MGSVVELEVGLGGGCVCGGGGRYLLGGTKAPWRLVLATGSGFLMHRCTDTSVLLSTTIAVNIACSHAPHL